MVILGIVEKGANNLLKSLNMDLQLYVIVWGMNSQAQQETLR